MLLNQLHDSHNVPWRDLAALFITSHTRLTPVWRQAASQHANGLVLWDYHVVALHRQQEGDCLVWDMDRWAAVWTPCLGGQLRIAPEGGHGTGRQPHAGIQRQDTDSYVQP